MHEDDVKRLLEIRIRRISAYDIEKSRREVMETEAKISEARRKLKNLTKTTIAYLEHLLGTYGSKWLRRTEITAFEEVSRKRVARANIKVNYDPKSGFFGSAVRSGDKTFSMSEYDRVLVISNDGTFRILGPEEKVLIPGKALHCAPFDPDKGEFFTVVYRTKDKYAFGKKIHIHKYVRAREYKLIRDPKGGRIDLLLPERTRREGLFEVPDMGTVHLTYVPKSRQRVHESDFDLDILELTAPGSKGRRLAPKPVSKIKRIR